MRCLIILSFLCAAHGMTAQVPSGLDGMEYHGTVEASYQEGCEGCGNRGMVRFMAGSTVDLLLPGSDIMDRRSYTRKGDRLTLQGGDIVMELKGDSLFVIAHDHRHPYVREKRAEKR